METGGGLFDEHPEIQAGDVSMGTDADTTDKRTPQQLQPDKGKMFKTYQRVLFILKQNCQKLSVIN